MAGPVVTQDGYKMKEEWRDVAEYEGLYQVSNLGNVRGNMKVLKNSIDRHDRAHISEVHYA